MTSAELISEEMLHRFCSTDDLRPQMEKPWSWQGFTGATDGHVMILIHARRGYEETKLDIARVVPMPAAQEMPLSAAGVREALDRLPLVDEMEEQEVECDECRGTRIIECRDCGQDRDCPECEGTGKVKEKSKPTGRQIPDPHAGVTVYGVPFKTEILTPMLEVAEALGADDIRLVSEPSRVNANMFKLGDGTVQMILMPYRLALTDKPVEVVR